MGICCLLAQTHQDVQVQVQKPTAALRVFFS